MYLDVADSATLPYGWSRYAQFSLAVINHHTAKFTVRKGMPLMMFICQLIAIVFKQHGNEIIIIFISSGYVITIQNCTDCVVYTTPVRWAIFPLSHTKLWLASGDLPYALCLLVMESCTSLLIHRVHCAQFVMFLNLCFVVSLFSRFISWMDISFFGMILQVVLQTVLCFENQNLEPAERGLHHGSLRLL